MKNDQIGLLVGRRLMRELSDKTGITVRDFTGSPLDFLSEISDVRHLIIVDSIASGTRKTGEVALFTEEQLLSAAKTFHIHGMNLAEAVATGRRLGINLPKIDLVGIEVGKIEEFAEMPDESLMERLDDIYFQVLRCIEGIWKLPSSEDRFDSEE